MAKVKLNKTKKTKAGKNLVSPKRTKKTASKAMPKKVVKKTVKKASLKKPISVKLTVKKSFLRQELSKNKPKTTKVGKDTGSVEVQIDNFTAKIKSLTKHLKKHGQDNDSRRGLLIMVGKRRRLLNYIKKSDQKRYTNIVKKLKLKE